MITQINPRNQGGLRYLFDLVDPQSNPEKIDMTAIQPVIDLNFGGFAKLNDYDNFLSCEETGDSVAGDQTHTWRILTTGNAYGPTEQIVVPVSHNFVLWGFKNVLYTDASGAASMNGKYISTEVEFILPDGIIISKYHGTCQGKTGANLYSPGFHGELPHFSRQHICVIPSSTQMRLTWWLQDGTTFPANTEVRYTLAGQAFPNGSPLPVGV